MGETGHEIMTGVLRWPPPASFPLEEEAILSLSAWCIFKKYKHLWRSYFTYTQGSNKWVPEHQSGEGCWVDVGRVGS